MNKYGFNLGLDIVLNKFYSGSRLISIAGGSCSGKTKLVDAVKNRLEGRLTIVPIDAYYFDGNANTNFDHPNSLELSLVLEHIKELKKGNIVEMPIYDFETHSRTGYELIESNEFILLEGLFALNDKFREVSDYNVYMQVNEKIALNRRIKRDVEERGRTKESVLKQFYDTVKPMYNVFVKPQVKDANLVIENNKELKF